MKRILIILLLLISLISFCQESKYNAYIASEIAVNVMQENETMTPTLINEILNASIKPVINSNRTGKVSFQLTNSRHLKFKMNFLVLPLFNNKFSVLTKKIFPNWEPFLSVLLNRTMVHSGDDMLTSNLPDSSNLGISFGAGLRLPLSQRILFDIGFRNEFGGFNDQKIYLKNRNDRNADTWGLTLGLSYKI